MKIILIINFFLFFISNVFSNEIFIDDDGFYNLIFKSEKLLNNINIEVDPLFSNCKNKTVIQDIFLSCDYSSKNLNNLYKINDFSDSIIYIIDNSKQKIYINDNFINKINKKLTHVKQSIEKKTISLNSFELTNYANYSVSGSYAKKISNLYHYFFNISYIKTSRQEDSSEWFLYEFRPKKSALFNKNLSLSYELNITGDKNFIKPHLIKIKSGNYVYTVKELDFLSNGNVKFQINHSKIDRIFLWYKDYDPLIESINVNISKYQFKLIKRIFDISKNYKDNKIKNYHKIVNENCPKYDCTIINVKNINDIKNINFNNKKLTFLIDFDNENHDIELLYKNEINFNENQYAFIDESRYKLKQKDEDTFFLNNIYLKKNVSTKVNVENLNIKNIDVIKKTANLEKRLDYMKIINISFLFFLIFSFLFKFKLKFIIISSIVVFILNKYYILPLLIFILFMINIYLHKLQLEKIFKFLFLIILILAILTHILSLNLIISEVLINIIYLITITFTLKRLQN